MPTRRTLLAALAALLAVYVVKSVGGCASAPDPAPQADRALVLVSLDGFRWDYLDRGLDTPALDWVAEGARAERLVPVFPTKTFPNHYSLVTGLHPETHGVVGNTMRDPERLVDGAPARFSLSNREAVADGRWWGGEPIWATAERQGVAAVPVFWPGSEAEIGGVRPTRSFAYDGDLSFADRAARALDALDDGAGFVSFYVEAVDNAGHRYGPDAPETDAAILEADAALQALLDGLRARGHLASTDVIVTSDHGMTPVSRDRVVLLDGAVDFGAVDVDWGEVVGLWPDDTVDVAALVARVDALPHVAAFRKADVPERLRYSDHARIPPVVALVDAGWTASSQRYLDRNPDRPRGGSHGYDNAHPDMHGVFLARGPRIRPGAVGALRTVDVYNVLAGALGLRPAPNDGDPAAAARVLR